MKELFDRVLKSEATKKTWQKDYASTEWKEASKVHKILNDIPLSQSGCVDCITDLFFQLRRKDINQIIKKEMNRQFHLKKDKVIQQHGCEIYTKDSSDEQLMTLLKRTPSHIINFDKVPDNWRELCGLSQEVAPDKKAESKKVEPIETKVIEETEETEKVEEIKEIDTSKRSAELYALRNADLKDILGTDFPFPKKLNKDILVELVLNEEAKA